MPVTPTGRAGCRMAICVGLSLGRLGRGAGGAGWAQEAGRLVGAEMFPV